MKFFLFIKQLISNSRTLTIFPIVIFVASCDVFEDVFILLNPLKILMLNSESWSLHICFTITLISLLPLALQFYFALLQACLGLQCML